MMTFADGYTLSQTPAICYARGKQRAVLGQGDADEFLANQLFVDIAGSLCDVLANKPSDRVNKWIAYLSNRLGDKNYFRAGDGSTAVDFSAFSVFQIIKDKQRLGKGESAGYVFGKLVP